MRRAASATLISRVGGSWVGVVIAPPVVRHAIMAAQLHTWLRFFLALLLDKHSTRAIRCATCVTASAALCSSRTGHSVFATERERCCLHRYPLVCVPLAQQLCQRLVVRRPFRRSRRDLLGQGQSRAERLG